MDLRNHLVSTSRFIKLTLLCSGLLGTLLLLERLNFSACFPIKTVKVYGVNRVSQTEVHDVLFPLVNHGFFSINVEAIRDRLLQMPWVSDLHVRRIWPDQVEVTVMEKKPIASWNTGSLLSDNGELFSPRRDSIPQALPKFVGPAGQHVTMLQHYNHINQLLLPLHASVSYLELTPYLTWKLKLDNGIIMQMGHRDVLTRLSHFVKVYPKIVGTRAADVDYIDLRYPNGVAVRWKERINT